MTANRINYKSDIREVVSDESEMYLQDSELKRVVDEEIAPGFIDALRERRLRLERDFITEPDNYKANEIWSEIYGHMKFLGFEGDIASDYLETLEDGRLNPVNEWDVQ